MSADYDRRLIEDYLPIQAINAEAKPENTDTHGKGYLSKAVLSILHRWWARRPLVASRAAVYSALVPAIQFVPNNGADHVKKSLGRANAAKFLKRLCIRRVSREALDEAAKHIRDACHGTPPKVLDMFAGGGSIPLEASRLGCESYALELNPVAHIVQLATLYFPPVYGQNLVNQVRKAATAVFDQVRAEVGELYPVVQEQSPVEVVTQQKLEGLSDPLEDLTDSALIPVAYLWTRVVPCKHCSALVPLHRQTWLHKQEGYFVAMRPVPDPKTHKIRYELLQSQDKEQSKAISDWGFDPTDITKGGETACYFCHTAVTNEHVISCCDSELAGLQMIAVAASGRSGVRGKTFLTVDQMPPSVDDSEIQTRLQHLGNELGCTLYDSLLPPQGALGFRVQKYGFKFWDQLYTPRQLLTLLTFVKRIRYYYNEMISKGTDREFARAVATYLAFILDKLAERSTIAFWHHGNDKIDAPIREGKLPMTWDFPEGNPFSGASGSWQRAQTDVLQALQTLVDDKFQACKVQRGSALKLPFADDYFDAVITDPPYYDNVPYAYLADSYYQWLKRTLGSIYPEHFAGTSSPIKDEAVMDPSRHSGNKKKAKQAYETMMATAFFEARRVLKPGAPMVCVYAHKTTEGWATLVEALRKSGFVVTEAWPLDTESPSRQRNKKSAALASSIFIVARNRNENSVGSYEDEVRPELEKTVRERVESLWTMGIAGGDLIIAAIGAGLRAFTRFPTVEYANGTEVPAEKFLAEVEGVVLETLMEKIFNVQRSGVAAVDPTSRFYVLWRYTYGITQIDAGEAIVFTYGQNVELDGAHGLSSGSRHLVQKTGSKFALCDYTERGSNDRLGTPIDEKLTVPLIDVLHRLLWLLENDPQKVEPFLLEAQPDRDRLRLVAQALAGSTLSTKEDPEGVHQVATTVKEQSILNKLLANWRTLVPEHLVDIATSR